MCTCGQKGKMEGKNLSIQVFVDRAYSKGVDVSYP